MNIFLDSDALVALNDSSDSSYTKAQKIVRQISTREFSPILGTNILMECLTIISQRLGKTKAAELLAEFRSGKYRIVNPDEKTILLAEEIFISIKSKNISYGDCVSFAVMRSLGITWVFSFDRHFRQQGFKRFGID